MHARRAICILPRLAITPRTRAFAHRIPPRPLRRICTQNRPNLTRSCSRASPRPSPRRNFDTLSLIEGAVHAAPYAIAVPVGLFLWSRHTVAPPNEYLVRPSSDWNNIKITKRGFVWPFQPHFFLKLQPRELPFKVKATTMDKQEIVLTGSITFGPKATQEGLSCTQTERLLIDGVLEIQVRRLCENLSFELISSAGKALRKVLAKGMQRELDGFGVHVYEVNIGELKHRRRIATPRPKPSTALQKMK